MRVMILSITAGYGHHSTANALLDELSSHGAEVKVVDVLEKINKALQEGVQKGYLFVTNKYMRDTYRAVYELLENQGQTTSKYSVGSLMSALLASKFVTFIYDYAPDAIICTHPTAAQIINELKRRDMMPVPTVGVITDYTVQPFWPDLSFLEKIVIPSELFENRALEKGFRKEQIVPFGIPVRPKFSKTIPKEEARAKFGLDTNKRTALVMSGSMGYGNLKSTVEHLKSAYSDMQILAVCGNNVRQKNKLQSENTYDGVHVYGFVSNVDEMMDAADCIVTKPGGLTVSEAMVKRLPMILVEPIPGQEERNVEFLVNNGMAIKVSDTLPLSDAVLFMFSKPERVEYMKKCMCLFGKPNSARDICSLVNTLGEKFNREEVQYKEAAVQNPK